MVKKGYVHSLEAVIASFILIGFVAFVYSYMPPKPIDYSKKELHSYLSSLEFNGSVIEENLTKMKNKIGMDLPEKYEFTVGLKTVDIYKSSGNITFSIPDNFTVEVGRLYPSNITENSTASLNGINLTLSDKVTIESFYFNTTNVFNTTSLNYTLHVYRTKKLDAIPDENVKTISYYIPGRREIMKPSEVSLYVW